MARHLLSVWNPSYATDAMDAHLAVLLGHAADRAAGKLTEQLDVYVWWGLIRSPNRQGPLVHRTEILALAEQLESDAETHLYLTDYRSLYVALLDEVTENDFRRTDTGEARFIPPYYEGQQVEMWFRLLDVRRLVANDLEAVIAALKLLRNTHYNDRPVSLYGGMVELPLVVTRGDDTAWFADRDALTGGRLWAEYDAALRGETGRMAAELRDNLVGPEVWAFLEPATRAFLATAEALYRAHRDDPAFDFSVAAVEYAKAVETEANALIFPTLRAQLGKAAPAQRIIGTDKGRLDLGGRVPHQMLGTMKHVLEETVVREALTKALPLDTSLLGTLPSRLLALAELRNPAAHSEVKRRDVVSRHRHEILGIGQDGLIVLLARARMRAR